MGLGERLTDDMKAAMRARDSRKLNLIRMVKARMTEKTTSKGFSGEVDDALWVEIISSYAKSQAKALEQFRDAGAAGAEHVEQIEYELAELEAYLPKKADEATTRMWVEQAIAGLGGPEKAKIGAVMGAVMKAHKQDVEAQLVRTIASDLLG